MIAARDSANLSVFRHSDPLGEQLLSIRRWLWILSSTLESLPAKIELAYRVRRGAGTDQPERFPNASAHEWMVPEFEGSSGSWWASRKLARLRSRADRAERRAAAAIRDASGSFGTALEAALQAAVARLRADEAYLGSRAVPCSGTRDQGGD
jgi:hypothetical protein